MLLRTLRSLPSTSPRPRRPHRRRHCRSWPCQAQLAGTLSDSTQNLDEVLRPSVCHPFMHRALRWHARQDGPTGRPALHRRRGKPRHASVRKLIALSSVRVVCDPSPMDAHIRRIRIQHTCWRSATFSRNGVCNRIPFCARHRGGASRRTRPGCGPRHQARCAVQG